ncbi:MAG: leucyl/phenylalanyl-tRNA--protein transferase [Muribaculaceae bacterium]|nr:leucyl/phenylalanyl-tRNA--protein transferase [Muribaculaceae bacterium]
MQDKLIVFTYEAHEPSKPFLICDINDGRIFEDPLVLFAHPEYDINNGNEQGLYAIGGHLDIPTLISAYKWGIFPWYPFKYCEDPFWHCPKERYVIIPEDIHIGHSLRNKINKKKYHITVNKDFPRVIHNCRMIDSRDENINSWLSDELEKLFIELNVLGYAKSIEVWEGEELAGGFYGFWHNGVFQGESMFSLQPSASQVGLALLCKHPYIDGQQIKLIDTQFETPTFKHLGGRFIPYSLYRSIMDEVENEERDKPLF